MNGWNGMTTKMDFQADFAEDLIHLKKALLHCETQLIELVANLDEAATKVYSDQQQSILPGSSITVFQARRKCRRTLDKLEAINAELRYSSTSQLFVDCHRLLDSFNQ